MPEDTPDLGVSKLPVCLYIDEDGLGWGLKLGVQLADSDPEHCFLFVYFSEKHAVPLCFKHHFHVSPYVPVILSPPEAYEVPTLAYR
jgi:hypothetical protein